MNREMIRITEADLHQMVKESVNRIIRESNDFIQEDDVLIQDEGIFGDSDEHSYDCKCYDGWAIGELSDPEDENAPVRVRLKYPRIEEVLGNEELADYVMRYRGLNNGGGMPDIHYGDIMMALGKIETTM